MKKTRRTFRKERILWEGLIFVIFLLIGAITIDNIILIISAVTLCLVFIPLSVIGLIKLYKDK